MLSESAWRPRCGAVLRALGEQADTTKTMESPKNCKFGLRIPVVVGLCD